MTKSMEILYPSKAEWDAFVDRSPQGILYCKSWWLDAVAPGRYAFLAVGNGQQIQAGWPIVRAAGANWQHIGMPPLTQKLGILFAPTEAKYAESIATQHRLTEQLIAQLAPETFISQHFHETFTDWLPFYWRGFKQTTRYTYVLDDLSDTEQIWNRMHGKLRNIVRKAQKSGLSVVDTEDVQSFYQLNVKTFARQDKSPPYGLELMKRIDEACKHNAGRKILIAKDAEGRPHAGIYMAYDPRCAVLLMSGGDPELRNSGAGAWVTWEAIRFAATVSRTFDFEGSMIRPIENFYREFGGRQTPYFRIFGRGDAPAKLTMQNLAGRALRKVAGMLDSL